MPGPLGLQDDKLGGRLGIDRRDRVGHARHRRHAAGQCGARPGRDGLIFFITGLAEMDMNIDQSGQTIIPWASITISASS